MAKYLKRTTGWSPIVLTVDRDFARKDFSLLREVPPDVPVHRSWTVEPAEWFKEAVTSLTTKGSGQGLFLVYHLGIILKSALRKVCSWLMELFSIPDSEVFWNISVIWKGRRIIRDESIRVVLVTSPPWSLQIAGYALKRLTGIPWIVDYRDPWTSIRRKNRPAFVDLFEAWLERVLLSRADLVLSTSDRYTEELRKTYSSIDSDKFQTLHNGYDEEKFAEVAVEGNDKFTIAHLGTLYHLFRPDVFFEALAQWISNRHGVAETLELKFIGDIPVEIQAALEANGLVGITRITGYVPHHEAIDQCRRSDVLLLALGTDPALPRGWLPSKLFEYLALNRPILACVAEGEAASMIRSINHGYVITREDKNAIVEALDSLYEMKWKSPHRIIPWENDPGAMEKLCQRHLMTRLGYLLDSITQ